MFYTCKINFFLLAYSIPQLAANLKMGSNLNLFIKILSKYEWLRFDSDTSGPGKCVIFKVRGQAVVPKYIHINSVVLTQKYMCTLLYKEISGKSTGRVEVYKQGDVYEMRSWWSGNCVIEY